jgi:hypothetical protein
VSLPTGWAHSQPAAGTLALRKDGDDAVSAFLIADKTLNRILSYLDEELRRSAWLRSKFEAALGVNFAGDWKTALGQKMWDLNQLALGYRYGDPKQELSYQFSPVPCPAIQAYKSMQCWLYQCCEGEIPETSKLFTFFDTVVVQHIANSIITKTPAYEQAEWG